MAAQDLGSLDDYLVNGDNYSRVQPDGSTLVIPSIKPQGPLAPAEGNVRDTYVKPAQGDCGLAADGLFQCALWVHDAITGLWHFSRAEWGFPGQSCLCALANLDPDDPNCRANVQAQVDSLATLPIWRTVAPWVLQEQNLPLDTGFFPDYWFIACVGVTIVIPNLFPPKTFNCPPPQLVKIVNGVPICIQDPPTAHQVAHDQNWHLGLFAKPVPSKDLRSNAEKLPKKEKHSSAQSVAAMATSALGDLKAATNPFKPITLASAVLPCGCGSDGEEEEFLPVGTDMSHPRGSGDYSVPTQKAIARVHRDVRLFARDIIRLAHEEGLI
jgi:hypothetical protein